MTNYYFLSRRDLDFVSVMCYDYHGAWEGHPYTGHNTPLYRGPADEKYIPHFNVVCNLYNVNVCGHVIITLLENWYSQEGIDVSVLISRY